MHMSLILLDAAAGTNDMIWFVVVSLGVLAVGAVLVILLVKFLKRLGK